MMIANVRDFIHSKRCDKITMGSIKDMCCERHISCTLKKDIGVFKKGYNCSHITVDRVEGKFTFPDGTVTYTKEMALHNDIIDIVMKNPIDRLDLATEFFKTSVELGINILEVIDSMIFNRDIIALDYVSNDKLNTILFSRDTKLTERIV